MPFRDMYGRPAADTDMDVSVHVPIGRAGPELVDYYNLFNTPSRRDPEQLAKRQRTASQGKREQEHGKNGFDHNASKMVGNSFICNLLTRKKFR